MKLLIFGDVFGKLGRAGVKAMLPKWRKKFSPDVVIANIENIAHGKGIGIKQINELCEAGVDIFTGGNHSLEGKDFDKVLEVLKDKDFSWITEIWQQHNNFGVGIFEGLHYLKKYKGIL